MQIWLADLPPFCFHRPFKNGTFSFWLEGFFSLIFCFFYLSLLYHQPSWIVCQYNYPTVWVNAFATKQQDTYLSVSVAEHYTINLSLHPILFFQGELLQQVTLCYSDTSHIWIPVLLVYKAVELVFSQRCIWDTQGQGQGAQRLKVYTIVVSVIALGPTTLLLQNKTTTHYAVIGVACLLIATVLLAIVYVPKITALSDGEHEHACTLWNSTTKTKQLSLYVPCHLCQ